MATPVSMAPRPPLVPLPGVWAFWADTITGAVPLGPLAPHAFGCTWKLSGFGSGTVTLPASSSAVPAEQLRRLWSWRLWALYDDAPVWCGVPTGVADEGAATVSLTLTELTGYLAKRQWDYAPSRRFNQVEQTVIAAEIAAPLADVGVRVVTQPGPGFLRDREYVYLEGQNRGELLVNLSNVISGPEFRSEYAMTAAGRPECVLRIAYPRVGRASGLGAVVPGSALTYHAAWDADQLRTKTFAVGDLPEDAPEGAQRPVAVEDRPQAGLPRLDEADDWPSTILLTTLRERAATMATAHAAPALALSASVTAAMPGLLGYGTGDDVAVTITSPLLPAGLEVPGRLTEITADAGAGTAAWTVALASPVPASRAEGSVVPPAASRETLTGRLNRLDSTVRGVFRAPRGGGGGVGADVTPGGLMVQGQLAFTQMTKSWPIPAGTIGNGTRIKLTAHGNGANGATPPAFGWRGNIGTAPPTGPGLGRLDMGATQFSASSTFTWMMIQELWFSSGGAAAAYLAVCRVYASVTTGNLLATMGAQGSFAGIRAGGATLNAGVQQLMWLEGLQSTAAGAPYLRCLGSHLEVMTPQSALGLGDVTEPLLPDAEMGEDL